MPYVEIVTKT